MTPQERELIQSVFDRLAGVAGASRDAEADALIAEHMRALPNAAYGLTQAVVAQELALKQAQARIGELERQLAEARQHAPTPTSGSFLGGQSNPWGQPAPSAPPSAQPAYVPSAYAQPAPAPWGQPSAGGGFLRGVAGTALGVAGGALLAEGISSLFMGGHHAGFGGLGSVGGGLAVEPARVVENVTVNNYYGDGGPDAGDSADPQDDGGTNWDDGTRDM